MKGKSRTEGSLDSILTKYQQAFSTKIYLPENNERDLLMEVFAVTPEMKRENRQYWGGKLGRCWEELLIEICREFCENYAPALRIGRDAPCDFIVGQQAIDAKYRIGSGDSGLKKKFKADGKLLTSKGYQPLMLIVREDNLKSMINGCLEGGWKILTGNETYSYIYQLTGFDLKRYLRAKARAYAVQR